MITNDEIERVKDSVRAAQEIRAERRNDDSGFVELLSEFEGLGMTVMSGMERRSHGGDESSLGGGDRLDRVRDGVRCAARIRASLPGADQEFSSLLAEFEETGMTVMSGIERRDGSPSPRGWS